MIYLAVFGIIVFAIGLAVWLARREGKSSVVAELNESEVGHAKQANQIDETVARMSDAQLDAELYKDKR